MTDVFLLAALGDAIEKMADAADALTIGDGDATGEEIRGLIEGAVVLLRLAYERTEAAR